MGNYHTRFGGGATVLHSGGITCPTLLYDATDDIYLVKEALGHKSVETTQQYLGISYAKFQKASENIELDRRGETLHSAEEISTSDMIVELQTRGVDMRSAIEQRKAEREKKAKIVKFPISDTV